VEKGGVYAAVTAHFERFSELHHSRASAQAPDVATEQNLRIIL